MTSTSLSAPALVFHDQQLDVVDRNNQPWLRLPQIGAALGYAQAHKVQKVYERHAAEFTDSMTAIVRLPTAGGEQDVRIFSLRGAHLLAMFARTERAAEFRRWVLDILDQETARQRNPASTAHPMAMTRAPRMSRALRQAINRKAYSIALEHHVSVHHAISACVTDAIAAGVPELECFGLVDRFTAAAEGDALPADQARAITERLQRLATLFHPCSSHFDDVLGILRALRGYNPTTGLPDGRYRRCFTDPSPTLSLPAK